MKASSTKKISRKKPAEIQSLPERIKQKFRSRVLADTYFLDASEQVGGLGEKQQHKVKVIPQLEEMDFYNVNGIFPDQYVPQSAGTRKRHGNQSIVRNRKPTHLHEILNNLRDQICFVGPAGSGKTTLLKAITRDVIEGKYENLKDMEVVHFINCRQFGKRKRITPGKLLFQSMKEVLSDEDIKHTLEVAKSNPSKVLLVLDSLDTLLYSLNGEYGQISLHKMSNPSTILWNLLAGKLIPGCRIITSSREHAITDFKGDLRARKIIALSGLTQDSMEQIICGYLGEKKTVTTMEFLENTSPTLKSLCSIPVFLVYTLIGLENKLDFEPKTMSGIMALLLNCFIRSKHAHVTNIEHVIDSLKGLSFESTKEKKVLFNATKLREYNLDEKKVTDMSVEAPGGGIQKLMKQDSLFFFSHQSIQETLSALHIAEMDLSEFESFVEEHIHEPHYCVVRRILCGILLDPQVRGESKPLLAEKELPKKGDILKKSLQTQLQRTDEMNAVDRVELFTSINEAQDGMNDVIESSLTEINLYNLSLSLSDIHVIGSMLSRCKDIKLLRLFQCGMYPELFALLESCIPESDVKIENLDLVCNPMNISAIENVGKIVKRHNVKSLDVRYCNLEFEHLKKFYETAKNAKISKLNLRCNEFSVNAMQYLAQIVNQCKVRTLILSYATLTADHLKRFKEYLKADCKMKMLDIGAYLLDTYHASREEVSAIIDLLPHVEEELRIDGWILQNDEKTHLKQQLDGLYPTKLKVSFSDYRLVVTFRSEDTSCSASQSKETHGKCHLDWSNTTVASKDMKSITKNIESSLMSVQTVSLKNCNLDGESLNAFEEHLSNCKAQVEKLDLSYNNMLKGGIGVVGTIARLLHVKHLDLSHCSLSEDNLHVFETSLAGYKLNIITEEDEEDLRSPISDDFQGEREMEEAGKSGELSEDLQQDLFSVVRKSDLRINPAPDTGCDTQENSPPSKKKRIEESDINTTKEEEKEKLQGLEQNAQKSTAINLYYENEDSVLDDISFKQCVSFSDIVNVANIIKHWKSVQELEFDSCDEVKLKQFYNQIKKSKFEIPGIAFVECKNMAELISIIGDMITKFNVVSLRLESCNDSENYLRQLEENWHAKKLDELTINCAKDLSATSFKCLAEIVKKCEIQKLAVCSCDITKDMITSFNEAVGETQIDMFDLSYSALKEDGVAAFGKTVQQCDVEEVDLSGCKMTETMITAFHSAGKFTKLKFLNLSDNQQTEGGIRAVAKVVVGLNLVNLDLSECMLSCSQIKIFAMMLGKANCKIQELDLSNYDRPADLEYIETICQLLPHVSNELHLIFLKMDDDCLEKLRRKLCSIPAGHLEIQLADKKISRKDLSASPGSSKE